jgi:hypothetical protein
LPLPTQSFMPVQRAFAPPQTAPPSTMVPRGDVPLMTITSVVSHSKWHGNDVSDVLQAFPGPPEDADEPGINGINSSTPIRVTASGLRFIRVTWRISPR